MFTTHQQKLESATDELRRWYARHVELVTKPDMLGLVLGFVIRVYRQSGYDKAGYLRDMERAWDVSPPAEAGERAGGPQLRLIT